VALMRADLSLRKGRTDAVIDLASAQRNAAAFMEDLPTANVDGEESRRRWVATWTGIGDGYCVQADLKMADGEHTQASDALLCALTAFEVARRLLDDNDPTRGEITSKIRARVRKFGQRRSRPAEWIRIGCSDRWELSAFFLPSDGPERCAPSVICISEDDDPIEALAGRLLPGVAGRALSMLIVSGADISGHPAFERDLLLGCCLDHLIARADVDGDRIAVYGEKFAAAHATNFAASDRRIAAAVCDGGLWNAARMQASIDWMAGAQRTADDASVAAFRLQVMRRLKCPILVNAGGPVSLSEAIRLHTDCMKAGIELDFVVPRCVETAEGPIENFLATDDFVFGWLERELGAHRQPRTITCL